VIARLRTLRDRPLDPGITRALVVLAGAVCAGLALLVGLGLLTPRPTRPPSSRAPVARSARTARPSVVGRPTPARIPRTDRPAQDPQDRPGSGAAAHARRELATHRALQEVPWHRGGLSVELVGARAGKAVVEVRAETIAAARRGYRRFLRHFDDPGRAYLPKFRRRGRSR
jgi:hypothetical protein